MLVVESPQSTGHLISALDLGSPVWNPPIQAVTVVLGETVQIGNMGGRTVPGPTELPGREENVIQS